MRFSKLFFAVVGATVVLGALVTTASAGRLENSSLNTRATWARMIFRGGIGNTECEVRLEERFHSRSIIKQVGSLLGYIRAVTVIGCTRGGMTINQASIPWHDRYRSFSGTLPRISGMEATVTGGEWRIREPTFGITCTVRAAESVTALHYTVSSGTITNASVTGRSNCEGVEGSLSGETSNVDDGSGARASVTLI